MKGNLLLGIRCHGRWSYQASGRLIKAKFTGNSLGGGGGGTGACIVECHLYVVTALTGNIDKGETMFISDAVLSAL